jgi:hypothetical protein
MERKNDRCILKGVDLEDPAAIRRLMGGLEYRLTHSVLNVNADELKAMSPDENALMNNIMVDVRANAQRFTLLLEAILRFVSARHGADQDVINAARELEQLAPGSVLRYPVIQLDAYAVAEARMVKIRGPIDILRIRQRLPELVCIPTPITMFKRS